MELSVPTVQSYIEFLENAFLIRLLKPYAGNLKKRLVKSPKVYIRDSGILHHFLGIKTRDELFAHPKLGASWEGFVLEQIMVKMGPDNQYYFYRTQDGAELDLVVEYSSKALISIEIKLGSDVKLSRGNVESLLNIQPQKSFMITKDKQSFEIGHHVKVLGIQQFIEEEI